MISRVKGTLLTRDPERIEVETASGVVYEILIPTTVAGRLPTSGSEVEIHTAYVVREDSATLYGFTAAREVELFRRLMAASGVGPKLALAMLSAYTAHRLARALAEKDTKALTQVSGVGKKTAERLVVELSDKVQEFAVGGDEAGESVTGAAREAVSALVALGYSFSDADEAVREVVGKGEVKDADELIRRALADR